MGVPCVSGPLRWSVVRCSLCVGCSCGVREEAESMGFRAQDDLLRRDRRRAPRPRIGGIGEPPPVPPLLLSDTPCYRAGLSFLFGLVFRSGIGFDSALVCGWDSVNR